MSEKAQQAENVRANLKALLPDLESVYKDIHSHPEPLMAVVGWFGIALLYRGYKIRSDRAEARKREQGVDPWPK